MAYIALAALIGILLLYVTDQIPNASVGGSLVIGLAFLVAALAVGIHEAWTRRRGVLGWIVNIAVSLFGAFVGAQIGGITMVMLLPVRRSLAATGGSVMAIALVGAMLFALAGAWGALQVVNRLRR